MSKASGWVSLDQQLRRLSDLSDLLKNPNYSLHNCEFGVTFGGGDDAVMDGVCPLRIIQTAGGVIAIPQGALVACDWCRGRLLQDVLPTPVYLAAENLEDQCGIPGGFCGFLCCSTGRVEKISAPQAPNYPSRLSLWGRAVCWEQRGSVSELEELIKSYPQTKYRFAVEWPVELAECETVEPSSKTSAVPKEGMHTLREVLIRQRGPGWLIVPIEGETGWLETNPEQNISSNARTSATHFVLPDGYAGGRFETTTMCTSGPTPVVGRECVLKDVDYSSDFTSFEWWLKRQAHGSSNMSSYHFPAFESASVYTMEFGK